ncbi:hypothetical protein [Flavobacterium psychrotrophum]|uniref:hypothetical protein n=1 Tax=Flavobacterium psychrotrophum TaxID=2294119 RepID=UPI0013C45AE4|nr:hypothetical protein [Flavobacterium psychrotrophum]
MKHYLTARHFCTEMSNYKFYKGLAILGILLIPFFIYEFNKKKDYNFYKGKVCSVSTGTIYMGPKYGYDKIYQPTVKYYNGKDTVTFTENHPNTFAQYYNIGDFVEVAEQTDMPWNVRIYTFWYFLNTYEIILFLLGWSTLFIAFVIIPGEIKSLKRKNS